jgi:hypothetical protein
MGHLGINRWQPLWFSHSSADSLNGQYPDPNSHLVCAVDGSCSVSDILVSDGGQITLGEVLPGLHQTAQWAFRGGSRLILSRGSRLIVNHGSRLIIESDGILEVHAGAEIFLVGDSSILEIRGRVVLGNDARFGFLGNGHTVVPHGHLAEIVELHCKAMESVRLGQDCFQIGMYCSQRLILL